MKWLRIIGLRRDDSRATEEQTPPARGRGSSGPYTVALVLPLALLAVTSAVFYSAPRPWDGLDAYLFGVIVADGVVMLTALACFALRGSGLADIFLAAVMNFIVGWVCLTGAVYLAFYLNLIEFTFL